MTGGMKQALHTSLLTFPAIGLLLLAQSCTDDSRGPGATAPIQTVVAATADQVLVGAGNIATCGGEDDEAPASQPGARPGPGDTLADNAVPPRPPPATTEHHDPPRGP